MSEDYKLLALIYGDSKTGKSFFANGAPGPRLVLDAEGGTRFLKGKKKIWNFEAGEAIPSDIDEDTSVIVYLRKYKTIEKIYELLDGGDHPFESVILDSISEIQQRCIDEAKEKMQKEKGTDSETLRVQDWGTVLSKVLKKIRDFRDLSFHERKSINVISLAMSKGEIRSDGVETHSPLMQGRIGDALSFHFDVVGYLFVAPDENGVQERYMQFAKSDKLETGDRTSTLPDLMKEPSVTKMIETIKKGIAE